MSEIKTIPYNLDAEQAVIGGLMLDQNSDRASLAFTILKPESFYSVAHQKIFLEMTALRKRNQPVDLLTLEARLKETGNLENLGGFAYLAEIAKNTPSAANVLTYAEIVREHAISRFALGKLQDCEALLFAKNQMTTAERLDVISRLVSEISDHSRSGKTAGLRSANDFANQWVDEWEKRVKDPKTAKGLSTGFDALDKILGGKKLVKQSLLVVGARPKAGKTSFLSAMVRNTVVVEKKTTALFSLEMSGVLMIERLMAQGGMNPMVYYDSANISNAGVNVDVEEQKGFAELANITAEDRLFIDDTPNLSMAHIRNECRRLKREKGEIGLIAVDYLTLIKAESAERNDLAYGQVTKDLKNLAREMDCVVLLLTQLNRKLEDRGDKRPMPSDSRDTGQIEQECDYWLGLYKESVYNPKADTQLTEIIVRLNRHGGTGTAYVEQKFGAMFECDQVDAERRSQIGKAEPKQKRYSQKDKF